MVGCKQSFMLFALPTLNHNAVDCLRTPRWRWKSISWANLSHNLNRCTYTWDQLAVANIIDSGGPAYLSIGECTKWLVSQWPYLIEEAAIAPDITGSGIPAIVKGLWSCPLNWNLSPLGNIVVFVLEILRETKISNLKFSKYANKTYSLQHL